MIEQCKSTTSNIKFVVSERGRKATFKNDVRRTYNIIKFDGCVVQQQQGADYIVSHHNVADLIVELKGCDVAKAISQIDATINYLSKHNLRQGALGAIVVCRRYPSHDTIVQRAKLRFSKKHAGVPIAVCCGNKEHTFDSYLGAAQPRKPVAASKARQRPTR